MALEIGEEAKSYGDKSWENAFATMEVSRLRKRNEVRQHVPQPKSIYFAHSQMVMENAANVLIDKCKYTPSIMLQKKIFDL